MDNGWLAFGIGVFLWLVIGLDIYGSMILAGIIHMAMENRRKNSDSSNDNKKKRTPKYYQSDEEQEYEERLRNGKECRKKDFQLIDGKMTFHSSIG